MESNALDEKNTNFKDVNIIKPDWNNRLNINERYQRRNVKNQETRIVCWRALLSDSEKTVKGVENVQTPKPQSTPPSLSSKIFLKAMPLRSLSDLDMIKNEVKSGTILIIKVSPLASKSIEDVQKAVNDLCEFVKTVDGDIARLGEERIVITPSGVRIWREKPIATEEQVPTAA
jgi:hypothetical protein